MRTLLVLPLVALAACGPDRAEPVADAASHADAAGIDATPTACAYTEQHDLTNDDTASPAGTPEPTGVTLGARTLVCGTFAADHFDGDITADVDGFLVTSDAARDVLVRIRGAGAEAIEFVGVDVYTSSNVLVGSVTFYGDHGVAEMRLPAGELQLEPFALSSAAIAATVAYTIEVVADAPATRCPALTSGGYAEAGDDVANDGNDVVAIPAGAPPTLTASPTDAPEPTMRTLAAGTSTRLTGSSADVSTPDQFEDKDTFEIAMDATTNELTVQLDWPGATANLDFLLLEHDDPQAVARTITTSRQGPDRKTISVKPGTVYWLLVGTKAGGTGLPIAYSATLCGAAATTTE